MKDNQTSEQPIRGMKDMTVGNPLKLILTFSIPLLIGNIFQQFYSIVDSIIVGRIIGAKSLAAIGTTGSLGFLILGFITGLTGGLAVVVAQYFGAKDEVNVRRSIAAIIQICIVMTVAITLISTLSARTLLLWTNVPADIIDEAWLYIVIVFGGIFATVLYNMNACILRALGDSKTPLIFLVLSSILNVMLDLFFILVIGMGVEGAAIATVIAQGVSGVLCLFYTIRHYPQLRLHKEDFNLERQFIWRHLRIGLPMALQFSVTAIGCIVLQGALNLFGSTQIAAYTAATKVTTLVTSPSASFGVTMANYCGQNLGAGKIDRIRDGVRKCTILSIIFALSAMAVIFLLGRNLTQLFVKKNEVDYLQILDYSVQYLRICALCFVPLFMIFVYRNVLQGIGRSFMPLMAGVSELIARVVVSLTLPALIGFTGICLGDTLAWIAAALPLTIAYLVIMRQMIHSPFAKPPITLKNNSI